MSDAPSHKSEATGNATLDRIQNNVRALFNYVRDSIPVLENQQYAALATDTTFAASAENTLATATISTLRTSGHLLIRACVAGAKTTNAGTPAFRVTVDDAVVKGCGATTAAGATFAVGITVRVAVNRGTHVVRLTGHTDTNSVQINAASNTYGMATLHVQEVR